MTALAPAEAIPQGLTPEQQLLLTNGMDPSMMAMAQVGTYDPSQLGGENYTVGTQGYYETGTPLAAPNESTEAIQQAAETSLVWAETKALENARKDGSNVFAATEAAQHDKDVARARHAIEEALGAPITKDVEEAAVKLAIDQSAYNTNRKDSIAHAVASGNSPVKELPANLPVSGKLKQSSEGLKQLGDLEETFNGKISTLVENVSEDTKRTLGDIGISEKSGDLNSRIIEIAGAKLATTSEAMKAEKQAVGEDVIDALASNKPRMKDRDREDLIKQLEEHDPKALRGIAYAVALRRRGGSLHAPTSRQAGKDVMALNGEMPKAA